MPATKEELTINGKNCKKKKNRSYRVGKQYFNYHTDTIQTN